MLRGPMHGGCLLALVWLVLLVGMGGCSSVRVRSDWDPALDFSRLQRFHWVEPARQDAENPFADNDLLRKRLRFSIERALEARGYRAVDTAAEADFLVTWDLTLEEKLRVNTTQPGFFYGHPRFWAGYGGSSTVRSYQDSTLLIDLLDPRTRELIWRGWADGVVGTRDRDRDPEQISEGVRQILDAFPPDPPPDPSR